MNLMKTAKLKNRVPQTQIFKNILIMVAGLSTGLLTGCSTDIIGSDRIHPEDIYQNYEISYQETTHQTEVVGTFRVGGGTGTTLEFKEPSQLVVNSQVAIQDRNWGSHYKVSLGQKLVRQITTAWTAQDAHVYTNHFELNPVYTPMGIPQRLSLQSETLVPVQAPLLDEDDRVSLVIEQSLGGSHMVLVNAFDSQREVIIVNPSELSELKPGEATIYVRRTRSVTLSEKTPIGGMGNVTYEGTKVKVLLE